MKPPTVLQGRDHYSHVSHRKKRLGKFGQVHNMQILILESLP
jgi:hypothetical protein